MTSYLRTDKRGCLSIKKVCKGGGIGYCRLRRYWDNGGRNSICREIWCSFYIVVSLSIDIGIMIILCYKNISSQAQN